MNDKDKAIFPCGRIPDSPKTAALLGVYPQRQKDLWLQRISIPGGVLTPEQWRMLGNIAAKLTPDTPLHLTTRQDIELHDLTPEQVPLAQGMIDDVGLMSLGAGGDSLRNITVCPCSGILSGAVDLHPLARRVRQTLEAEEGILSLPRKFKISFSCSHACGSPWINDLGFVVRRRKGQYGFRLIGAGSLGAKPGTGIILFDWLVPEDAPAIVIAAVRVFAAHGDREHRRIARFRHIRERLGNKKFVAILENEFASVKSQCACPPAILTKPNGEFTSHLILTFPNGDLTPQAAEALADLTAREDIRVRISHRQQVTIFGHSERQLREAVAALNPLTESAALQATLITCPGTRWCKRALVDTNRMARRIRAELGEKLPPNTTICISGCPNGCTHSAVAGIGLIGQLISKNSRDGQKAEAFNLFIGGAMGQNDKLAELIASRLSEDEVLARIDGIISTSV